MHARMNVHPVLHLHNISGTIHARHTHILRQTRLLSPHDDAESGCVGSPEGCLRAGRRGRPCQHPGSVVNAVRHGLRTAPQAVIAGAPGAPGAPGIAGASALRLCLLRRVGEVMLAVTDPSNEAPTPRAPGWTGESGRGLQIVGALSYVWGWSPIEGRGKAVWAVLRCS